MMGLMSNTRPTYTINGDYFNGGYSNITNNPLAQTGETAQAQLPAVNGTHMIPYAHKFTDAFEKIEDKTEDKKEEVKTDAKKELTANEQEVLDTAGLKKS